MCGGVSETDMLNPDIRKILVYNMSVNAVLHFSSHENQQLSNRRRSVHIDSEIFVKTLMLRARPRPSSSNQFEKRQSQWDCDKTTEVIFPVDFPALTTWTHKYMCLCVTWVSKTVPRVPRSRIVSFASAPHWEHHEISALNPTTMTVKVLYSRGKKTVTKWWVSYGWSCVLWFTNFRSHLSPLSFLVSTPITSNIKGNTNLPKYL